MGWRECCAGPKDVWRPIAETSEAVGRVDPGVQVTSIVGGVNGG